jgi:Fur family ferric uptake transcriptional regulator
MERIHHQEKQQFRRLFEDEGIDRIKDRLAILGVFLGIERHISFQELIDALKDDGYSFEPDFVKKTLNLLCRYGFATKKKFEGRRALYEHRHLGFHHDHLICTKCGKIDEFESRQMEDLQVEIAALHGFHVLQHKMEIYGLCSECLEERVRLMPLSFAQEGELGIVKEFMGGAGAQLNGMRLALGRGIAKKIMVKPNGRRKGQR